MTREEAAEALYRAACVLRAGNWTVAPGTDYTAWIPMWDGFTAALDAYSTSTPDPLPAEVQRVLEAALAWRDWMRRQPVVKGGDPAYYLLVAVDAYRWPRPEVEPEPLSARLARLRPGSVVDHRGGVRWSVAGNDPTRRWLWVRSEQGDPATLLYDDIRAILSESP